MDFMCKHGFEDIRETVESDSKMHDARGGVYWGLVERRGNTIIKKMLS